MVGPPDDIYRVPTDIACQQSVYFNAMINGPAPKQSIHMGGSSLYTVLLLLEWLYHQTTTIRTFSGDFISEHETKDAKTVAYFHDQSALFQLWVVADKLSIPALQNSALSQLDKVIKKSGLDIIFSVLFVYANTSKRSELRRYLLAVIAIEARTEFFENEFFHSRFPREFLVEMGHYLLVYLKSVGPRIQIQEYFVH
jgi:hypothetical protein